jgi:hypothetical protein
MAAVFQALPGWPASSSDQRSGGRAVEFSKVFRGRELTRKDRRLCSGLARIDAILNGGIARGRVSEIVGQPGSGRTSLAASFIATATRHGEVAAWIDAAGAFDPQSIAAAGADLSRVLWVGTEKYSHKVEVGHGQSGQWNPLMMELRPAADVRNCRTEIKAAEMVLSAEGFGLVVIDLGERARTLALSAALRLARAAERSGTAVIVLGARRACGTFAALSLVLRGAQPLFSRGIPGAPALFDGIQVEARVMRNKLGGSGQTTSWQALVDPACSKIVMSAPSIVDATAAHIVDISALPARAITTRLKRSAAYPVVRRHRREAAYPR